MGENYPKIKNYNYKRYQNLKFLNLLKYMNISVLHPSPLLHLTQGPKNTKMAQKNCNVKS